MKFRKFTKFGVLIFTLLLFKSASADSPLTSTPFNEAYEDISIVNQARLGVITNDIANYLHSEKNPIDIKAAVINALGWDPDGKSNALTYCNMIYNRVILESDINSMTASELFVVGYLNAMDNYMNPTKASPFLKQARKILSRSFTVNIIYSLVKAQKAMDLDFCKAWKYTEKVFDNDQLTMDMRPAGKKIIYDYMVTYKSSCN